MPFVKDGVPSKHLKIKFVLGNKEYIWENV